MSNDIRPRTSSVGSTGAVRGGTHSQGTHTALSSLAARVAGEVARNLELISKDGDGESKGQGFVLPNDLYRVRQEADSLASQFGATPAQAAQIARALNRFAEVCATLIAARPAAFSIEQVKHIVSREAGTEASQVHADAACAAIDRASAALEAGAW
ncbi:MAG: hypothetical protein V2J51_03360 [Erythrobacter sp.]|jgi:hypothetical protein|nr:hypothetical protein [Erythrobacter sp.]